MTAHQPMVRHLHAVKQIVSAALAGQHDKTAVHAKEFGLALKGAAEGSLDHQERAQLLEFAQWIDGQISHNHHIRNGEIGASRTAQREAEAAARFDPVQNLLARRVIGKPEVMACSRISRIFDLLASGLDLKARDYGESRVDNSGTYRHPVDRISYADSFEISMIWRPWSEQMRAVDAGVGFEKDARPRNKRPWWHMQWREYLDVVSSGGTMDARLPWWHEPNWYLPWAQDPSSPKEKDAIRKRLLGLSCYDLVRLVLIDRRTIRSVENLYHTRNGSLTAPLVAALRHYNALTAEAMNNGHLFERAAHEEMRQASM